MQAATVAATAFARLHSASDSELVEKILLRLKQDNANQEALRDVALALFRIKPTSPVLSQVAGEKWMRSQIATTSLKKIPKKFQLDVMSMRLY